MTNIYNNAFPDQKSPIRDKTRLNAQTIIESQPFEEASFPTKNAFPEEKSPIRKNPKDVGSITFPTPETRVFEDA